MAIEELGIGVLLGLGLARFKRSYRPAAKSALKFGLTAAEALKDALHESKESLADILAEVKHEISTEARAASETEGHDKPPSSSPN